MRGQKKIFMKICFYLCVFMTLCGFDVKDKDVYYDQPLGNYITFGINPRDKRQITKIKVSKLMPGDLAVAHQSLADLQEKYNGRIIKWQVSVSELTKKDPEITFACNIWLEVSPVNAAPLSMPLMIRTQSVPGTIEDLATPLHPNVCDFWEGFKQNEIITVVGELNFTTVAINGKIQPQTQLHIRPMVIETEKNYYIDNNLHSYIVDQILKEVLNKKEEVKSKKRKIL